MGFANTRAGARQMVTHGHIKVNNRKVNIPSYAVKPNDVVEVRDSSVSRQLASRNLELSTSRMMPDWISVTKETFKGHIMRMPSREDIQPIANEQAVVEFYSR
jgi:small subunit ribosomal protein S4